MQKEDIPGFETLQALALDMRWSGSHVANELWAQLDPEGWAQTRNPWIILQTMSASRLQEQLALPALRNQLNALRSLREEAVAAPSWYAQQAGAPLLNGVAYFSMEFMLSESLPIYVGGLGNVAGDQLKAASDLGVPVTGIGLLYQQGYFRQVIDGDGNQQAYYPFNDPGQLPLQPLLGANGEWLRIQVPLAQATLWLRTWEVQVGRLKLYLLDSNDLANPPYYRGITSQLYGGDTALRLQQEIALGIGGWRLLEALGQSPAVCHLNEGHAAFAILERAASYMSRYQVPFETALSITRAGNLFTTHTAVAAGFDHFEPPLLAYYLGGYAAEKLQLSIPQLLALGRQRPDDEQERFNMAYLAINGSGAVNGVSRLHGQVSQALFEPLFYRWPPAEIPVGYVTNGIHVPSWESLAASRFWGNKGNAWVSQPQALASHAMQASDAALWQLRNEARSALVDFIRRQTGHASLFNPTVLTIGFARRFVPYKRPDLLLHDPQRLVRLLTNPARPLQLVVAGKAPPSDEQGKALIRHWVQFIRDYKMEAHVVFLQDYDMQLAAQMIGGVDVWLNTPRRPWEACGTSGMKVLVNGGLNLSELDGWWAEAYAPDTGWALGDGYEHGDDAAWDAAEAASLYQVLEQQVVTSFYERNEAQLPTQWTAKMRQSMTTHTFRFSATRAVSEYTTKYYLPAAARYQERTKDNAMVGKAIVQWQASVNQAWPSLEIGDTAVQEQSSAVGPTFIFSVPVHLAGLDTSMVQVTLYAAEADGHPQAQYNLQAGAKIAAASVKECTLYTVTIPATRAASDYTVRITPAHVQVAVPLENRNIRWQH
ncbi:alpha-glucan family phosphorylase [Chitinophaga costaii]|nr:alpha-glucan family phosphorylase [Chitinophaga costaii]PUZ20994.1 alpha-glucan family phosphorylase [Chitinophaga costaii]